MITTLYNTKFFQNKMFVLLICALFLLTGCGARNSLAPVSELKWYPFSKHPSQHIVRRGETLYAIAFRYDTDYRRLAALNHISPPYSLRVGQVLIVKGVVKHVSPKPNAWRPSPKSPQAPKRFSSPFNVFRSSPAWVWPVRGRVATSFIPSQGKKGINIACDKGARIHASASGVVAYSGSGLAGYGNLIIIKHDNEYLTAYGNNVRNLVSEGQRVSKDQVIAIAGIVDRTYWGVHFEIRKAGVPVNPLIYLEKG